MLCRISSSLSHPHPFSVWTLWVLVLRYPLGIGSNPLYWIQMLLNKYVTETDLQKIHQCLLYNHLNISKMVPKCIDLGSYRHVCIHLSSDANTNTQTLLAICNSFSASRLSWHFYFHLWNPFISWEYILVFEMSCLQLGRVRIANVIRGPSAQFIFMHNAE